MSGIANAGKEVIPQPLVIHVNGLSLSSGMPMLSKMHGSASYPARSRCDARCKVFIIVSVSSSRSLPLVERVCSVHCLEQF